MDLSRQVLFGRSITLSAGRLGICMELYGEKPRHHIDLLSFLFQVLIFKILIL